MSAWAKPGVKCVFVGGGSQSPSSWPLMTGAPKHGVVYTIRETAPGTTPPCLGQLVVRLVETVVKPHNEGWEDAWLSAAGFRPLITRTQPEDVALFRELLTSVPANLETVDLALLPALVDDGTITFAEYAAQLSSRGLTC